MSKSRTHSDDTRAVIEENFTVLFLLALLGAGLIVAIVIACCQEATTHGIYSIDNRQYSMVHSNAIPSDAFAVRSSFRSRDHGNRWRDDSPATSFGNHGFSSPSSGAGSPLSGSPLFETSRQGAKTQRRHNKTPLCLMWYPSTPVRATGVGNFDDPSGIQPDLVSFQVSPLQPTDARPTGIAPGLRPCVGIFWVARQSEAKA